MFFMQEWCSNSEAALYAYYSNQTSKYIVTNKNLVSCCWRKKFINTERRQFKFKSVVLKFNLVVQLWYIYLCHS